MANLTMANSIAGDTLRVALAAHDDGLRFPGVLAPALRGALLVDLALEGRLTAVAEGPQIDTTPTGLGVADELLNGVNEHPDRTMEWWLRRGTPHLHELIAELIHEGCWTIERHGLTSTTARYLDAEASRFDEILAHFRQNGDGSREPADEREASLTCLAAATGAIDALAEDRIASLREACGPVGWVVRDVTGYLAAAQADDLAAGQANVISSGLQIGSI